MPEKDDIEEIRWIKEAGRGWELYQKSFYEGMQCAIEAASHFKKAEKLLRESGDDFHLPLVLDGLGAASHILGTKDHLLTAVNYFDEEIKLLKTTGRLGEVPHVIGRQQAVYRDLALLEPEKGMVYLEKGLKAGEVALTLAADFKDERSLAWVSQTTADLCCVVARLDSTYLTSHLDVAIDLYNKASLLWDSVQRGDEGEENEKPLRGSQKQEAMEGRIICLLGMAEAYIMMGKNLEAARDFLEEAYEYYSSDNDTAYQQGHIKSLLGSLSLAQGHQESATTYFKEARDIFRKLGFIKK